MFQGVAAEIGKWVNKKPIYLMINNLPPGITVPWHNDPMPEKVERWHLPLTTNDKCLFEVQSVIQECPHKSYHMTLGKWWGPIRYWTKHRVSNGGTTERYHIVVDLL